MGGVSGSGVHNAKSVCVWFLVNSSDHFVCRVHGESSQNTGNGVSGFGYNSADPGSCTLPYYELDADERLGKFPEGWDLYNTFCGQYGGGYDVNDHCVSNGLAVDVQAAEDVVTVCRKRELQREIPRLQIFRNVIRFSHMENSWKKRVHVYTTLQGNPRRTFLNADYEAIAFMDMQQSEM